MFSAVRVLIQHATAYPVTDRSHLTPLSHTRARREPHLLSCQHYRFTFMFVFLLTVAIILKCDPSESYNMLEIVCRHTVSTVSRSVCISYLHS